MEKIDFSKIGFEYHKCDYRFVSKYKDGKWDDGELTTDNTIVLSEAAGVLHYAQECFEGLKAFRTVNGDVVVFRPDMNAERLITSCRGLCIPEFPKSQFIEGVKKVVKANIDMVPPYETGASLYIRPVVFATGDVIGVKPATEYEFRIFATPTGPYFKEGVKPIAIRISNVDRAAPRGTGSIKAGLNYAMSLKNIQDAHDKGFAENLYLDPATKTYIEETGGANIFFVDKDDKLITPLSPSILPSITKKSLITVSKKYLGLKVIERKVELSELTQFKECFLCGTAAVVSPVGMIANNEEVILFPSGMEEIGPITKKVRETLVKIQSGEIEAPEGWIVKIEEDKK